MPSREPAGSSPRRNSSVPAATCSRVHSTAAAAVSEKEEMSSPPSTARSWLPTRQTVAALADQLRAGVGLGAVADDVAEAPDLLDVGRVDRPEDRLEGGLVGVDVAEDGYAQAASVPWAGPGPYD